MKAWPSTLLAPVGLSPPHKQVSLSPAAVPLGTLPPASAIASIATISQIGRQPASMVQSFATLPALVTATSTAGTSGTVSATQPGVAMVLSSALPAKLVAKITSGQFVAMKELLADNMSLCHQLESFPTHQHLFTGVTKPRLREIDSPLTWVSCFLAYAAVRTTDEHTRNLLTYGRLVVREAQRHSGPGWLEYDRIFRQHAALSASTAWHTPLLFSRTVRAQAGCAVSVMSLTTLQTPVPCRFYSQPHPRSCRNNQPHIASRPSHALGPHSHQLGQCGDP